ncbi:MAG: glycosyltransferase, partial [Rikenellaceae bacterium]|nr:glycosyltransferase [Rikenellaceae bacterium]
ALAVAYLFIFALFSLRRRYFTFDPARVKHRIAVLVPAHREDAVIGESVASLLAQDYPQEAFDIVVIADRFEPATLDTLRRQRVRLLEVNFEQGSKARALNYAMQQIAGEPYEVAVILDADNTVGPDFLSRLNDAYHSGAMAVQAHRKAGNLDTDTALLDALSEEINNSIFRKGHVALGISSALIGSGMALDFRWLADHVGKLVTAGEDKELEVLLLREGVFIEYLDDVEVLDAKTRQESAFYIQRRRWLAAQFYALGSALGSLPGALLTGNIDFCDKCLQWMMPPRILLLGGIPLWAAVMTAAHWTASLKWWGLWLALLFALSFATPDYLVTDRLRKALRRLPVIFALMAANLLRMRGQKNRFVRTEHGA